MKKIKILILLLCSVAIYAQENGENRLGSWHMYFGTNRISDKFSIHTEAQLRYYEQGKEFNQLLLRTGLNYHFAINAMATVGYAYIDTDPTYADNGNLLNNIFEHRVFEQFILTNKVEKVAFEHRYRLEHRFLQFENSDSPFFERRTEHRARYRLQVTWPLSKILFLNFYDEVFVNLQNEIFGQNRLYGAFGFHVFKKTSLQIGYLKNHFRTAHFDRLQIGVFINPDLRKEKAKS